MNLPPPNSPEAPKYWMYETGGKLVPAIKRYLKRQLLNRAEIEIIRLYIIQWINSPVWLMNPELTKEYEFLIIQLRNKANLIKHQQDVDNWLKEALKINIDPL